MCGMPTLNGPNSSISWDTRTNRPRISIGSASNSLSTTSLRVSTVQLVMPNYIKKEIYQRRKQVHRPVLKLDLVKKAAAAKGVAVRTLVSKSDMVSHAIITASEKNDCDLIVMASHGRRGIKRLLLGSETQHVLTHSSTPVLVLR